MNLHCTIIHKRIPLTYSNTSRHKQKEIQHLILILAIPKTFVLSATKFFGARLKKPTCALVAHFFKCLKGRQNHLREQTYSMHKQKMVLPVKIR